MVKTQFNDFYFSLSFLKKEIESKEQGYLDYYDSNFMNDKLLLVKVQGRFIPFCEQIKCGTEPLMTSRGDLVYLGAIDNDEVEYKYIKVEDFKSTFNLNELYDFCLSLNSYID